MTSTRSLASLLALAALNGAAGCNNGAGPGTPRPVDFHLAAASTARAGTATAPVEVASLRLVVGPAALGSGDQFGCVDCQGGDNNGSDSPQLIQVPTDGTPVLVRTEQVTAGHYGAAEIELKAPDAAIVGATPDWPAARRTP